MAINIGTSSLVPTYCCARNIRNSSRSVGEGLEAVQARKHPGQRERGKDHASACQHPHHHHRHHHHHHHHHRSFYQRRVNTAANTIAAITTAGPISSPRLNLMNSCRNHPSQFPKHFEHVIFAQKSIVCPEILKFITKDVVLSLFCYKKCCLGSSTWAQLSKAFAGGLVFFQ